ncbi:MAG: hypothetical protein AUI14_21210 [Actinobacteria bacterium 13_2_20CM_2_71_6]|nr:MAG: hypothetical protein AUI14_21210 [Actinobacteria bacterium 13_2_20CM_2_71_6]
MTVPVAPPRPAATEPPTAGPARPAEARPARKRRSRRWLRLVIPFAVVLALLIGTGIVHMMQEPDVTDPAFLSPTSSAPIGAQRLASQLTGQGVTIDRVTKTSDALVKAYQGEVTLFVPAPSLVHAYYLRMLKLLPSSTRVVLVQPSPLTLTQGRIPVSGGGSRWATKAVVPNCGLPEAAKAGIAGVYHSFYGDAGGEETARCYGGALLGLRYADAEVLLVGATDPFRNDRIGEYGNAALATGLLAAHRRVIWLDLHRNEPAPGLIDRSPDPGVGAPPSLGTGGSPDPEFPVRDPNGDHKGDPGTDGGNINGGGGGSSSGGQPQSPPYWKLLPAWAWARLGLLGLAAFAFALTRCGPARWVASGPPSTSTRTPLDRPSSRRWPPVPAGPSIWSTRSCTAPYPATTPNSSGS